jgi:dihydropteroate synthase
MTVHETLATRPRYRFTVRGRACVLGERTWVMGILNVTPDSFSDGGRFDGQEAALARGLELFEAGADVVDVGGESTRPGAAAMSAEAEIRRVVPVIAALRARGDGLVSVDTTKAAVAKAALEAGADIVNDVSGFRFDPALPAVVADADAPVVLMHLRGAFATMHGDPHYRDVAGEIAAELRQSMETARAAGIAAERVVLDPGIGFAKSAEHSLEALRRLGEFHALGRPLLVGPSRKSFIGKVLDAPVEGRLFGTAAAVAASVLAGAHVVRVHDVAEMAQVARVCDAILGGAA